MKIHVYHKSAFIYYFKKKKLVLQIIILKAKDFDFEQSINGFMFKMPNKNADETTS